MNIESVGPDDHDNILGTWFFKGVTTTVLTKSSSKEQTDVNKDRSREMLNEMIRVTTKTFSNAMCMRLREKVGDIDYSFNAKWSQIEEAFYAALEPDQVVSRYSKFIEEGAITFGGKPMEQTISDISNHVSKCFGRDSSNAQWCLGITYKRIFEVAQNLPVDFKQIRNHILQTSGDELSKISEAKTIPKYLEFIQAEKHISTVRFNEN